MTDKMTIEDALARLKAENEALEERKARAEELSRQHDLDHEGYGFEAMTDEAIAKLATSDGETFPAIFAIDDPPWDYLLGGCPETTVDGWPAADQRRIRGGYHSDECLWIQPTSGYGHDPRWPEWYRTDEGVYWRLRATGSFFEGDHECDCHGSWIDGAVPPEWEYTGNHADEPHPECRRCDGDGYMIREAAHWATYARIGSLDALTEALHGHGEWLALRGYTVGPDGRIAAVTSADGTADAIGYAIWAPWAIEHAGGWRSDAVHADGGIIGWEIKPTAGDREHFPSLAGVTVLFVSTEDKGPITWG